MAGNADGKSHRIRNALKRVFFSISGYLKKKN